MHRLPPEFYQRDTLYVAPALIGCFLIRKKENNVIIGRINETEAYVGLADKACHAYQNKYTERTKPMFANGGIAYVYFVYGKYHCLNVVTEAEGVPCAVLLRGVEIVEGLEHAALNRYKKDLKYLSRLQLKNMSNGPGKLCQAFAINGDQNQASLQSEQLFICEKIKGVEKETSVICAGKRIGIAYAGEAQDYLWRFYEKQ